MTPNNNFSVLPWYSSKDDQNARKWWIYDRIYPLFCPNNEVLPFQIILPYLANLSVSYFKVYRADGTLVGDFKNQLIAAGFQFKNIGTEYSIGVFTGGQDVFQMFPIGRYYAEICFNDIIYRYSEIWTAVQDMSGYLKIEWWNNEDLTTDSGTIVYTTPAFKNKMYLCTELAKPEYIFEEDGEERDGYFYPLKQISEKRYKFKFIASEYLLDVMRFIRLADYIRIVKCSEPSRIYVPDTFLLSEDWEDAGDVANVSAEFDTYTVAKKIPGVAVAGYLDITPGILMFEGYGGTQTATISTNLVVNKVYSDVSWLSVSVLNNIITATAPASTETDPRAAHIIVEAGNIIKMIEVNQKGFEEGYLELSLDPSEVPSEDASGTLTITTNQTVETVTGSESWLHLVYVSEKIYTYTCDNNTSLFERTATITVTAGGIVKTVTLTQAAAETVNAMKFEANAEQSFYLRSLGGTWTPLFEYSYDGATWLPWINVTNALTFGTAAHKFILLRGKNTGTLGGGYGICSSERYGSFVFLNYDVPVYMSGDYQAFVNYEAYEAGEFTKFRHYCFYNLFKDCGVIKSAPEFPYKEFGNYCFLSMFEGAGLTKMPAIRVFRLGENACHSMFKNCRDMTEVDALEVGLIDPLIRVPIGEYAFRDMFNGCNGITEAPEIKLKVLSTGCCYQMFANCTSLKKVVCYATDITAQYCLQDWLYNVGANGTLIKRSGVDYTGTAAPPSTWTIENF